MLQAAPRQVSRSTPPNSDSEKTMASSTGRIAASRSIPMAIIDSRVPVSRGVATTIRSAPRRLHGLEHGSGQGLPDNITSGISGRRATA